MLSFDSVQPKGLIQSVKQAGINAALNNSGIYIEIFDFFPWCVWDMVWMLIIMLITTDQ